MKILIAADGSDYTKRMLAYIAAQDDWLSTRHDYTVLTAVLAVPPRAASFVGSAAVTQFHEDDAEAVFGPIRDFFQKQGIEAKFVFGVGNAAEVIATHAEDGRFDLLVMGSRGNGEIVNLVLGSVATKVLARTSVPVLLIR